MKMRNGFVSNSSSSSFVVAFPKKPESAEDVKKMMFGDDETFQNIYAFCSTETEFSTRRIAETVYNDILKQVENDVANIIEGFNGFLENGPKFPDISGDLTDEQKNKMFDDWQKEYDEYQKKAAMKFIKEHKNMFIYTFEYSDNDGIYFCNLEHGKIFDRLEYVQISRH